MINSVTTYARPRGPPEPMPGVEAAPVATGARPPAGSGRLEPPATPIALGHELLSVCLLAGLSTLRINPSLLCIREQQFLYCTARGAYRSGL